MRIQIHQIRINLFFQTFHTHGVRRISHSCQHLQCYKYQMMVKFLSFLRFKAKGLRLTMDAKDRRSALLAPRLSAARVIASFPEIISKSTTPNAYTSLLFVAIPSLRYLQRIDCTMSSKKSSRQRHM